uniref:Uncharacterized protein n=1 Tax=Rhizophora mucronata TaxID=61149 RepID=A0A2P2PBB2_RHIMU
MLSATVPPLTLVTSTKTSQLCLQLGMKIAEGHN